MGPGKSAFSLGTNVTLTGSYVQIGESFRISDESLATVDLLYTTGAGEVVTTMEFKIEFSTDGLINWVQESVATFIVGVNTLSPMEHSIVGGVAATVFTAQYYIPLCSRFVRIKVKESGVVANAGSLTALVTIAAASGQSRNLQIPPSFGIGTDVNIHDSAGAGILLGQQTMANSLPVTIASNQSAIPVFLSGSSTALTPFSGQTNVAAGPVATPLVGIATQADQVTITAKVGNADDIFIGPAGVTIVTGLGLTPAESVSFNTVDLNDLYIIGTAGEGVTFAYLT